MSKRENAEKRQSKWNFLRAAPEQEKSLESPEEFVTAYSQMELDVIEDRGEIYGLGHVGTTGPGFESYKDVYAVFHKDQVIAELDISFDDPFLHRAASRLPRISHFGVVTDRRREGWATLLFEAAERRFFASPYNSQLDHGSHSALGVIWWRDYCRTHAPNLSKHLNTDYSAEHNADKGMESSNQPNERVGRLAGYDPVALGITELRSRLPFRPIPLNDIPHRSAEINQPLL